MHDCSAAQDTISLPHPVFAGRTLPLVRLWLPGESHGPLMAFPMIKKFIWYVICCFHCNELVKLCMICSFETTARRHLTYVTFCACSFALSAHRCPIPLCGVYFITWIRTCNMSGRRFRWRLHISTRLSLSAHVHTTPSSSRWRTPQRLWRRRGCQLRSLPPCAPRAHCPRVTRLRLR